MRKFAGLLFFVALSYTPYAQITYISNVTVIDVKAGKALPGYTVIINGEKIEQAGLAGKVKIPANANIIDGTGKFLMPGMTDAHIHFFQSGGLYTRPDIIDLRKKVPYEKEKEFGLQHAADYLQRYLRLGITTVIDVGGPMANFVVRDSITQTTKAPDVLVTGPLFSMIGLTEFGEDKPIIEITGTKAADSLLQKMLPYKPDFIKIWYITGPGMPAEKNFPLVKYIAEQTHRLGLKLAVHATELKTAKLAVDAGTDILVHSVSDEIIPDDLIKIWKDKKVTYISTLIVGTNYYRVFAGRLINHPQDLAWANAFAYGSLSDSEAMTTDMPPVLKYLRKTGIPASERKSDSISGVNLLNLMRAGINIATGTDAGNIGTLHASSYLQELEAMQKAGLTITEILKASTINPATGFGREQYLGSIEKGKTADLLLLGKNPLESLQHLNTLTLLFKKGQLIKIDSLINESPEEIVQRQLNAYNARDIDAFLDTYADDIELYNFGEQKPEKGKDAMRKKYGDFFRAVPNLYCSIVKRIVIGNKVIDHENVRMGEQTLNAVAVYEVEKGKIKRVTFIR